jgi:predicted transcriptional regulator
MHLVGIRHLPVLDNDGEQLVGIVTQRKMLDTLVVKEVITTDVITTTLDTSLVEAAKALMERKIGCLPVFEDGRLVGIIQRVTSSACSPDCKAKIRLLHRSLPSSANARYAGLWKRAY